MTMKDKSSDAGLEARQIVATRILNAPRELVFRVWTEPDHVAKWWGPKGFTNTIHEMDVRPGGVWRLIMHSPDGVDYRNKIIYTEVRKPELLAYTHVSAPKFDVTVTFVDKGAKHGSPCGWSSKRPRNGIGPSEHSTPSRVSVKHLINLVNTWAEWSNPSSRRRENFL